MIESAPIRALSRLPPSLVRRVMRTCTARNLRLASGLVMAFFVATHLLNHALGLVSLQVMEAGRIVFLAFWRETPAGPIFLASVLIHIALAYHAIYRRHGWRTSFSEAVQLLLGIAIPPLLILHVLGTAVSARVHGADDTYAYVLLVLWTFDPALTLRQVAATLVVWGHASIGLHYWLRLKSWYGRTRPWLYAGALLLPALALLGFVSAGREVARLDPATGLARTPAGGGQRPGTRGPGSAARHRTVDADRARSRARPGARGARCAGPGGASAPARDRPLSGRARGPHRPRRHHPRGEPGERHPPCVGMRGPQPVLDVPDTHQRRAGRAAPRVPGGTQGPRTGRRPAQRAPCLPAPAGRGRVRHPPASPQCRAARRIPCGGEDAGRGTDDRGAVRRHSRLLTGLSETKLPYDVVFVLNRYFRSMGEAIEGAGGRVDKFIGDGIMALFGIDAPPAAGAAQALAPRPGGMAEALDDLNQLLASDLPAPRSGSGSACTSDRPSSGQWAMRRRYRVTAVGDTVNTASRLESMTKEFAAQLVVSADLTDAAGADLTAWRREAVQVRGRKEPLSVFIVDDARGLPAPAMRPSDGR